MRRNIENQDIRNDFRCGIRDTRYWILDARSSMSSWKDLPSCRVDFDFKNLFSLIEGRLGDCFLRDMGVRYVM
jgi:hypothetical protein